MEHPMAERLHANEGCTTETICLKVTISKKRCVTSADRTAYNSNNDGFFKELDKYLSNRRKYKINILVVGNLNKD